MFTTVVLMLCAITTRDPTTAPARLDIMEMDAIVDVIISSLIFVSAVFSF